MSKRPITVFHGSISEAMVLRGRLEANGIFALLCDENIKVIDPFVTGADSLSVDLQVSSDEAEEARAILGDRQVASAEEPAAHAELRRLGQRIRWASLLVFAAPFALYFAFGYFRRVRRLGYRPEGHAFTIAAVVYSLFVMFVFAAPWVGLLRLG